MGLFIVMTVIQMMVLKGMLDESFRASGFIINNNVQHGCW
ncbi:hypothetical protein SAMN05421647_11250 [Marinobacterium stanieri]|uniref:Uncharacterized protein n=1 Tax=Marinobacterium stanieri TaxID=49186 RepID=A0A1N6X063_9GAMM|nr:hypothetical protein SAMN05421647_11250 [Marinobacterium stanieri]